MSKSMQEKYGTVIAEMRRRKYAAERTDEGVKVGLAGLTILEYELEEEDLDTSVSDLCDELEESLRLYLEDQLDEELDDDLRMNPEVAKYIRRKDISEKSKRLLKSDPNQMKR